MSSDSIVVINDSDTDTEDQSCSEESLPCEQEEADIPDEDSEDSSEASLSLLGDGLDYTEPLWRAVSPFQYEFDVFRGTVPITRRKLAHQQSHFTAGRDSLCDLYDYDDSCESVHAILQAGQRRSLQVRLYLYSLGESGSFVNGIRVPHRKYIALKDGDVLRFGQSEKLFYFQDESTAGLKDSKDEDSVEVEAIHPPAKNDALWLPNMTSSQMVRLQTVVEGVEEFGDERDQLTRTQVNRLQVHLDDLVNVRTTLTQMLENNLDDEDITNNLINLLEYLNHGIDMQERLAQYIQDNETELDPLPSESDVANALALSQVISAVAEDEFAERESEIFSIHVAEEAELMNALNRVSLLQSGSASDVSESEQNCYRSRHLVPDEWRAAQEDEFLALPTQWDRVVESTEGYTRTGVYMCTWAAAPWSGVQYVEIQLTSKAAHAGDEGNPLHILLCDDRIPVTSDIVEAIPRNYPLAIIHNQPAHIVQSEEVLRKSGDTLGIGLLTLGGEFLVFTTYNGQIEYQKLLPAWKLDPNNLPPVDVFQSCFEIVLSGADHFTYEISSKPYKIEMETCSICFVDVADVTVVKLKDCGHSFCYECLRGYLMSAMNNGEFLHTTCLENICSEELSDEVLENILSFQEFSRFKQFRALARLRLEPNCRWCPTVDCPSGVVANLAASDFPKLHCADCDTNFCYHCSDFWHEGETCDQYATRKREEKERGHTEDEIMQKWLEKYRALPCPKCRCLVQKLEGCNHITCPCGAEFCWICGEEIIPDPSHRSLPPHYDSGPCAGKQFISDQDLPYTLDDLELGGPVFHAGRRRRGPIRRALRSIVGGITMPVRGLISVGRRRR